MLRPDGRVGPVWNIRDETVDWVVALTGVMHGSPAERLVAGGLVRVGAPFPGLDERRVRWSRATTVDGIAAMAASRSDVIALRDDERADVLTRIREPLTTHPSTAGRATLDMPYETVAYRATLP